MANRPTLSLQIRANIDRAKAKLCDDSNRFDLLFLPVQNSLTRFAEAFNPQIGTTAPRQPESSALHLQIEDFTGSMFDVEAQHYSGFASDPGVLLSWLNQLATEVSLLARRLVADDRLDFHLSPAEREKIIADALEARIRHWTPMKQTLTNALRPTLTGDFEKPQLVNSRPNSSPANIKSIGERLDDLALHIGHDALAHKIRISRSSYFKVKGGGGGKTVRKKAEAYLLEQEGTNSETKLD
jgi:hypothetical protein